ncbi:MAG: O-antigen ligase family protein [Clostridia bacterium]|nr:O-antigen ligase family protein [Clostridia bacterium]
MISYLRYLNRKFTLNEKVLLALFASAFISVYAVMLLALLLPVYVTVTKQWKQVLAPTLEGILLVAFWIVAMVVSAVYGDVKSIALAGGLIFAVIGVLFFSHAMTKQVFVPCLTLSCYLSIPCFIVAVLQFLILGETEHGVRFASTFMNPNYYGTVIEVVILFAIYCLLKERRPRRRMLFYIVIAVNIAGLLLCQCRTSWMVLLFAAPLLFAVIDKKFLYIYAVIFVALLAIVVFAPSVLPRIESLFDDFDRRANIWQASWLAIKDKPLFGHGCIAYSWLHSLAGSPDALHAHNIVLELLLNFGVVGTSLLTSVILINIRRISQMHKHHICQRKFALALATLAAVLVHGLTDITFFWPQTGLLIIGVLFFSRNYEFEVEPLPSNEIQ